MRGLKSKGNFTKKVLLNLLTATVAMALVPNLGVVQKVEAATKLNNPQIVSDSTMNAGKKVTWDCVWFGSYPQTEVAQSDSVYRSLQEATDWDENGDITLHGVTYRRILKEDATYASDGGAYYQWTEEDMYHYFRYEPIKWRVLDVSDTKALLLSNVILDNQQYNHTDTDITWVTSTIKQWLNAEFKDSAFSSGEQNALTDEVFLLSEEEITTSSYGFCVDGMVHDEGRNAQSSDYAKAMGIFTNYNQNYSGSGEWWLRSQGSKGSSYAASVYFDATVLSYGEKVNRNASSGVRVALNLALSESGVYSYAGMIDSEDGIAEPDGDVNQDGNITAVDALLALKMSVNDDYGTKEQRYQADVDSNGTVTTDDVLAILKCSSGENTSFYE